MTGIPQLSTPRPWLTNALALNDIVDPDKTQVEKILEDSQYLRSKKQLTRASRLRHEDLKYQRGQNLSLTYESCRFLRQLTFPCGKLLKG